MNNKPHHTLQFVSEGEAPLYLVERDPGVFTFEADKPAQWYAMFELRRARELARFIHTASVPTHLWRADTYQLLKLKVCSSYTLAQGEGLLLMDRSPVKMQIVDTKHNSVVESYELDLLEAGDAVATQGTESHYGLPRGVSDASAGQHCTMLLMTQKLKASLAKSVELGSPNLKLPVSDFNCFGFLRPDGRAVFRVEMLPGRALVGATAISLPLTPAVIKALDSVILERVAFKDAERFLKAPSAMRVLNQYHAWARVQVGPNSWIFEPESLVEVPGVD